MQGEKHLGRNWLCAACALLLLVVANRAAAQPLTLLSSSADFASFNAITNDGNKLYVSGISASTHAPRIWSLPLSGGTAAPLYNASQWISSGSLYKCCASSLAVLGHNLFWIDPYSGPSGQTQIFEAPTSPANTLKSPILTIYTAAPEEPIVEGTGLTTDGLLKLYAGDAVGGTTWSLNLNGSDLTQLASAVFEGALPTGASFVVAFGQGTIYAAYPGLASSALPPQVLAIPATGGSIATLASGAPMVCPNGIAVGNGMIFIADPCAGTIWELSEAAAKPSTPFALFSGAPLVQPQAVTFASVPNGTGPAVNALFVADNNDGNGGNIYRLASF